MHKLWVQGYIEIWSDVMMVSEVVIYIFNNSNKCIEKPMIFQGFTQYAPVVIADDIGLGAELLFFQL